MTTKIEIQKRIEYLQEQITNKERYKEIKHEIALDQLARTIISTLNPLDQDKLINQLQWIRARLVQHFPVNGIKGACLYLNLIQNTLPSPLCPAYNKMRFPTVSTYNEIGSNISCITLDSKALEYVPKIVLEKTGPLEEKELDLFWTAIDGRFYSRGERSLNHSSHSWAHRHAVPGATKILVHDQEIDNPDSNIAFDVNMGIFPEFALEASQEQGAIAINHMSPMNVHVHAGEGLRTVKSADMLYSPDNAHFRPTAGTPFSIDWSVMQKEHRVAITKRLIIFDYHHPICIALLNAIRDCDCLETHLQRLSRVSEVIEKTFLPLIEAFESNNPDAKQAFDQLPLSFQHGIYHQAWILFDSPQEIHGDFGKASFEENSSLDEKYYCDDHRRAEAVRHFSDRLKHQLVESQFDLLFRSQSLIKDSNVLTMMKCARLFYKDPEKALNAFGQLLEKEREAVLFAFWELNGCRRIDHFSKDQFPLHSEDKREIQLKIQAILLAASRQSHPFKNLLDIHSNSPKDPPLKQDLSDKELEIPLRCQVSEKMIELIFNPEFQSLDNPSKAHQIDEILSSLGTDLKNAIYGKVYSNSRDPRKGGESWGQLHVANDPEVLINSIHDVLKT